MGGATKPVIVFVANELGNFWHHRGHLVSAAHRTGMHSIVMAAPIGKAPGFAGHYRSVAIERFRFHAWADLRLLIAIFIVLIQQRPHAINLINLKPFLLGGLAARLARLAGWRGNVVITVPGLGRLYDQSTKLSVRARRLIVERLLRSATKGARVTFETRADRNFWISKGIIHEAQAVVTAGAGIDLGQFLPSRRTSRDTLRVLFAGRLLKAKGLDIFLEVANRNLDPQVEMLVAGTFENDPDTVARERLFSNPHITFLGMVEDMPELLSRTDIVVLPTRYNEGVPRILIEAAACGCVPIATRFPGSEAIIEHGRTGFFLEGSTASMIDQLGSLIVQLKEDSSRRTTMGARAVMHVRTSGFDSSRVAETFLGLFANPDHSKAA